MKKRAYLVLTQNNKVLIVREVGDDLFKLPGGRVEEGEENIKALNREIDEEIQVSLKISDVEEIGSYESVGKDSVHYHTTLYQGKVNGVPKPDGKEIEEIGWYDLDNPKPSRVDFQKNVLPILKKQGLIS